MTIPSCYRDGYEAARKVDPELADMYIRYTTLGDPVADAVCAELAETADPGGVHRIIATTVNHHDDPPKDTPDSLLKLIADANVVPEWFDPDLALKGTRAFIRNSDMVLGRARGWSDHRGFLNADQQVLPHQEPDHAERRPGASSRTSCSWWNSSCPADWSRAETHGD